MTGHERPGKETSDIDWDVLARFAGTLVFLMGVGRLDAIADALIAAGKDPDTPAAVVASGTLPAQRTVAAPLVADRRRRRARGNPGARRHGHRRRSPACATASRWAEARPLHGRTIAVTRARAQASVLVARLRDLGARVVECPTIRIEPIEGEPLSGSDYDLVCVTSPNAPRLLLDRLGGDARALAGCRVAAIGPGTAAALRDVGIVADVVAERSIGEGLVEALGAGPARCPRARRARRGCARHPARRPRAPPARWSRSCRSTARCATRRAISSRRSPPTSSRSARPRPCATSWPRSTGRPLDGVRAVSIGPVTSEACREHGIEVVAEAGEHDLDGLVEAIVGRSHESQA